MYLTKRQRQILDFIKEFIEEKGYSPSLEEIGAGFGLTSPATVHKHVMNLIDKGLPKTGLEPESIDRSAGGGRDRSRQGTAIAGIYRSRKPTGGGSRSNHHCASLDRSWSA